DDLYRELSLFRDNAYPEPNSPASRVRVGQTWEDTDKRSNKRLIRILEIRDGKAIVETTRDRYGNRSPSGRRRTVHVRLDRFQKRSRDSCFVGKSALDDVQYQVMNHAIERELST